MSQTMDDILADQAKLNVLRPAPRLEKVECGCCGWTGRRKPGNVVYCPTCGSAAAFQIDAGRAALASVEGNRGDRG